ncbi:hypothetical protein POX_e07274 [Penicillium oxalicum]|uniref:hypothetical protein n=1 Tax=Penicillium oxalicum TaxID=69781 RepID=UPI0020B70084|nr:hypothetical protein POX_e07274 [Penicillium oxalicum]KAI2789244.1 hypothetical protein POX_e07274 [Penicillium oxalicum]
MNHHSPPSPSFGERRGRPLAPLQTNFSRPTASHSTSATARNQRPRPADYISSIASEDPVPLQGLVKRQSSKSSLRHLFARERPPRATVAESNAKLVGIDENQLPAHSDAPSQTGPMAATMADGPVSPSLTSPLMTMPTPAVTSPTTPRPRSTLKSIKTKPAPVESAPPLQEQYGWKPPPLFQAYPQAYKHDCLSTPSMSADAILRLHATMGPTSADATPDDGVADPGRKKKEQKERKHLRTLSGAMNKVEWADKIYVLVTAGYILQYAGEGKNDRLPEKMLQLGPQSVAFASDAIPGRHWVLQVSQSSASGGSSSAPRGPRTSRFSRFGFNRSNARRLARSFLLVFDNPDSMISWLMAVRQEIEVRGGPRLTEEKHSDNDDDQLPRLRNKSSTRSIVKRDPHRISSLFLQSQSLASPEEEDGRSVWGAAWQSRRSSYVSTKRQSLIGSRRGSESTGWAETSNNGSATQSSSCASAAPPGALPRDISHPAAGGRGTDIQSTLSLSSSTPHPGPLANRQSYFSVLPAQTFPAAVVPEAISFNTTPPIVSDSLARCASPPAPNFSVPSFSKKFVSRPGPPPTIAPPAPTSSVLRRGERVGDLNHSGIPSPPQSPTYSVISSRPSESPRSTMTNQEPRDRRTLRPSNSEDTLPRAVRSPPDSARLSRLPHGNPSESGSPSSRPRSLVGQSGLGIHMAGPVSALMKMPTVESVSLSCQRALATNADQTSLPMPRRKSMPGLSAGPPMVPPPNCPLPKIPAATVAHGGPTGQWSRPNERPRSRSPAKRSFSQASATARR